jgi:uncharacterized protein YbaR (Trm112 family)
VFATCGEAPSFNILPAESNEGRDLMALDKELLEILRCPKCKGELEVEGSEGEQASFVCRTCKLRFPVVEGIPNFIVTEAEPVEPVDR